MEPKHDLRYSGDAESHRTADPAASLTAWESLHGNAEPDSLVEETDQASSMTERLEDAVRSRFAGIADVRHVLLERGDKTLPVWIAIDSAGSPEVRRQVYAQQLALLQTFPAVDFDFNLIPAMGRTPAQLASQAEVLFSRA